MFVRRWAVAGFVALAVSLFLATPALGQTLLHRLIPPKPSGGPVVQQYRDVPRVIPPQTLSAGEDIGGALDAQAFAAGEVTGSVPMTAPAHGVPIAHGGSPYGCATCGRSICVCHRLLKHHGFGKQAEEVVITGYQLRKPAYPYGYFGAEVGSSTTSGWRYRGPYRYYVTTPGYPPKEKW